MAPASPPRRSSRARSNNANANDNANANGTSSQHSSSSSSRGGERSTRLTSNVHNKFSTISTTPSASISSESPLDEVFQDNIHLLRRRKRPLPDDDDEPEQTHNPVAASAVVATADDDMVSDAPHQDGDDAVRCICGSDEYPGLPHFSDDHRFITDAAFYNSIELTDDVTGFFLQCDTCKVWQHGACVGIISTEVSPDEYFCEKCRKDLHKIHTASNGQFYSHYLPLHRPSRNISTSRATSIAKDGNPSPKHNNTNGKGTRPSSSAQTSKRRSTMNSRDAAYDEDEQLRRAIEASKEDAVPDMADSTSRRVKRGRSESEDNINVKRQRTSSASASPSIGQPDSSSKYDSDDGSNHRISGKKSRMAARNQRDKELDEKQRLQAENKEKAKQRAEQSNKRKDRAERRRGDEPDPPEDTPRLAEPNVPVVPEPPPPAPTIPPPDTPPPPKQLPTNSHKKSTTRSHQKKPKGRNQYTKDREIEREESPEKPTVPRDLPKLVEETPPANPVMKMPASDARTQSKPKPLASGHPTKMTMHEMKRRAAAYLEFITRTQVELATEVLPWPRISEPSDEESKGHAPATQANGIGGLENAHHETNGLNGPAGEKHFKDLNSMEMLDVLTRRLVKWQNQFAD